MAAILSVLLGLPFAVLLILGWHAHRRARSLAAQIRVFETREAHLLAAVRSFINASRVSSASVIETLARTLTRNEPAIDTVLAFAPDGDDLACVYSDGARAEHYRELRMRRDAQDALPARAALAGHRITAFAGGDVMIPTDRAAIAVPLHDEASLRAVLYVSSSEAATQWSEDAIVRTIEHAAAPYSIAIEREADRADATYDGLTGLLTPRAFRIRLQEEIMRARFSARTQLTLWFVDTDCFKSVNDTHGHAAGDVVLHGMAGLLRLHAVPDVDIVGRNGGDEFCALLHGVQKTLAIERAQQFCDAVRAHDFGVPARITASIGVATFPFDAQTSNELLEIADAAMYHSKRTGRDRVSFAVDATTFAVYR
jgi:diguanylate cyclase (GGDEF)-like protein